MSCPFGETGCGKMGDRPPIPQELRAMAPRTRPIVHSRTFSDRTAQKYIDALLGALKRLRVVN